ncbi:MAG TPA: 30S ribosomal protein S2, partial [bacterium]|nr:30S ribosomal protein S2 [bacterium]
MPFNLTIKQLLEAGVHFGHQTKRWNPKMRSYIYGARNGVHIIDLQKSMPYIASAYAKLFEIGKSGKTVLFVGTKRQASLIVAEEAQRCGMPYVNERWLGGMLTNFTTIKISIQRLKDLEALKE